MRISKTQQEQILSIISSVGRKITRVSDVESEDGNILVKPGAANFVTVFDISVQKQLISGLQVLFPDAYFFAEEKENPPEDLSARYCFYIDPIDGTTNFIHDMRCSAVSVALYFGSEPVFGAVYDPYADEIFYAAVGEGAYLNGNPIRVSDRPLEKALVSFGTSPYNREDGAYDRFERARRIFMACADIRRSGSAAIDICFVACGRTDAFFEDTLSPWDFAAGGIILKEAGGKITSYNGCDPVPGEKSPVLCSNNSLHSEMLRLLN